jgi:hypothetical protein
MIPKDEYPVDRTSGTDITVPRFKPEIISEDDLEPEEPSPPIRAADFYWPWHHRKQKKLQGNGISQRKNLEKMAKVDFRKGKGWTWE